MKNLVKRMGSVLTALVVLCSAVLATGYAQAAQVNEFEYLKEAIQTIDSVPAEEINQYVTDNREWIDEVGARLEAYLETVPSEQRQDMVTRLMGGNPAARAGNLDEYFNYTQYHLRNGYWTYTMDPKWSVRLFGETMRAAWAELGATYYGIRNDNGSLWNQYRCHWDYDAFGIVAGVWDIEVGRPLIPYEDMFAARCNP